jgi:hypothetical protein
MAAMLYFIGAFFSMNNPEIDSAGQSQICQCQHGGTEECAQK